MSAPIAQDRRWLEAAARLAAPFLGTTAAAPTVGAVLVDPHSQRLLARAVTPPGGNIGAVALALAEAGEAAGGATLYLTLEPGIGSPDRHAVEVSGIGRLVVGAADPASAGGLRDPTTFGDRGLSVSVIDDPACRTLHEGFLSVRTKLRPFVTARLAVSADGKIGRAGQGHVFALGETARRWIDMQRALADAVMIGWGTATNDDPDLGVGLPGLGDRSPLRLVVAGLKTYQPRMKLVTTVPERPVAVIAIPEKKLELPEGIDVVRVKGQKGRPDLTLALGALAQRGVQSLLVETGPTLTDALLTAGLVDRFHLLQCEATIGADGIPAMGRGTIEQRLIGTGFSLVDHRLLGADNLRTFERLF